MRSWRGWSDGVGCRSNADTTLLEAARDAARRAYAPYSRFGVGAAARTRSGRIHVGANMENASYGLAICAEVSALARAVADGDFRVTGIAVAGGLLNAQGMPQPGGVVTPCGRCRQLIKEAADVSGTDITVFCANADLSEVVETRISELLPRAFGPTDLGLA